MLCALKLNKFRRFEYNVPVKVVETLLIISKCEIVVLSAAKRPIVPVCYVGIPLRRLNGMTILRYLLVCVSVNMTTIRISEL